MGHLQHWFQGCRITCLEAALVGRCKDLAWRDALGEPLVPAAELNIPARRDGEGEGEEKRWGDGWERRGGMGPSLAMAALHMSQPRPTHPTLLPSLPDFVHVGDEHAIPRFAVAKPLDQLTKHLRSIRWHAAGGQAASYPPWQPLLFPGDPNTDQQYCPVRCTLTIAFAEVAFGCASS